MPASGVTCMPESESTQLPEDPSLIAALVLCNSGAVLWRDAAPRLDLAWYRPLAAVVNTAAVAVYLFGLLNVYRAPWLAAAAVLAVALHQITAPVREVPEENAGQEDAAQEGQEQGQQEQLEGAAGAGDSGADEDSAAGDDSQDSGDEEDGSQQEDEGVELKDDGEEQGDGVRRRAQAAAN